MRRAEVAPVLLGRLAAWALIAAVAAVVPVRAEESMRVFPYPVETRKLDNGLEVIAIPMSSEGLVAYWTIVRTGSRDEYEPGRTGFAHFFEHMMFQGTEAYPAERYNAVITRLGADANAYTTDDLTAYHLGIAAGDLETVMEVESDRFRNLSYARADFETEAGAVYGEYRKNRTNPFFAIYEAVQQTAFTSHTYGHTTMGYERDIQAMPKMYDYSLEFFDRYYRPDNVSLLVVGDIEPSRVFALAERYYGKWKRGYRPPSVPEEPAQQNERSVEVRYDGQSLPILWMAYKAPRFDAQDKTYAALDLAAELAFGETSALHKKLVLDEQLVEFVSAEIGQNRDPGLFDIYTRVKDPANVDRVQREIDQALATLRDTPPDAARLAELQSRKRYQFLMRLDTPDRVASALARVVAFGRGVEVVDQLYATYASITPEDIQQAARKTFVEERRTVAKLFGKSEQPAAPPHPVEVIELPVASDPTITVKVWFPVGSQNDPPGKEGLAFLTGSMLAEGSTTKLRYEQILEELFPLASGYSVRVDREMTVITGRTHRDNLDAFFTLLSDAVLRPAFLEEDFTRLRTDALNGLRTSLRYASDEELGKAALAALVFEGTRYAHPPLGTVRGLESITLEDVRAFYREHFTADAAVVALGGGYDESFRERARTTFGALPGADRAATPPPAIATEPIDGREVLIVDKPGADASISVGVPIDVHRGDDDFYALWVANSWLGEHRNSSSHLFQVIRERRGLNYGDYSYIEAFPEGGGRQFPPSHVGRRRQMFEVWIRTLPDEQAVFALRAALREVERLVREGLTQEQFELTRASLSKYVLHFAPTTEQRLGYAVDDRFYGIEGKGHLERFAEKMRSLTLRQVNEALARHIDLDALRIAIVSGDAVNLARKLTEGAPSPIEYAAPKSDEILAEDRVIASWPLQIETVRVVPLLEMFEKEALPPAERP